MKSTVRYFGYSIVLLCVCLASQYCAKETQIKMPNGVLVSGDSAYYPEVFSLMKNVPPLGTDVCFPSFDSMPKVIKDVKVGYPKDAITNKVEGNTQVKVWIDEKGIPRLAVILKSSDKMFNEQSLIATMNTLFTPAIFNKKPLSSWIIIPYKFKLQ
jgi:TonB family protein